MILVTGATGEYGHNAIRFLLEKGVEPSNIAALVRDADKAKDLKDQGVEIRIGDYKNYDSLVQAFKGIDKLLFVSGSEIEGRDKQHENVVNAAIEAGVNHVVYTSFLRDRDVDQSAIAFLQDTHFKTESWLKNSGLKYTILQNALYMDMIPMFVGEGVVENGVIKQPAENGKASSVLRKELAEAAAEILTSEGHINQVYPLSNPDSVSYQDIANDISKATGKEIKYISPSPEDFQNELKEYGVPAEYIGLFTAFSVAQANGELDVKDNTLEKLLGRKPTTAEEFISQVYG